MADQTEYAREQILHRDVLEFSQSAYRHFLWFLGSSGLAIALAAFTQGGGMIAPWVYWIIAASGIPIACFLAWRDERRAKEKAQADLKTNLEAQVAIPDITGAWNRIDIGTIEITRDEFGFHSKFDINTFEHRGNPVFNAVSRRFEYVTTRYDSSNGTKKSYAEYLWVLDSDTLVFYAPKNAGDFPDSGVLNRAKI